MSLLLLAAAVALAWFLSYWVQPTIARTERQRLASIGLSRGVVFHSEVQQPPGSLAEFGPPWGRRLLLVRPPTVIGPGPNQLTTDWRFAGFTWRRRSPPLTYRFTAVPCCAVLLPLAAPALVSRWRRRRRERRLRRGHCTVCGYDLRATPARCPECGAAAATPAATSQQ